MKFATLEDLRRMGSSELIAEIERYADRIAELERRVDDDVAEAKRTADSILSRWRNVRFGMISIDVDGKTVNVPYEEGMAPPTEQEIEKIRERIRTPLSVDYAGPGSTPMLWMHRPESMRRATREETESMERLVGHHVENLMVPDDGPTAADCAAKPFSESARPWMGIALNHDFSSNSIGRMRQVGLHIQVELFEPLTREQIFQIFGGAGISVREIVGDKIKRFDILEFSFCPAAAAP